MARRPKLSKSKSFPMRLNTYTVKPPTLAEFWFGEGTNRKLDIDDDDYDDAVASYEDTFGTITFKCDCVVFNLEEWADVDCFYPENKKDMKPFETLYRRSYKIALSCDTWWEDGCYTHYADNGKFCIVSDNGFYDDLNAIGNKFVRSRIEAAFRSFLDYHCDDVDDASPSSKDEWEPDEWHATSWDV